MNKRNVLICAGGGGPLLTGFTMAEILLSLTIIGVVAAITLPSLTGNINERTWNTQRKALYARMSQAIALMPALNGYGVGATVSDTKANAAQTFLTAGLSKVLKINNICDNTHLKDCGFPASIIDIVGSKHSSVPTTLYELNSKFDFYQEYSGYSHSVKVTDTDVAAFETISGESLLVYYNPECTADITIQLGGSTNYVQNSMCANFIYDLNGSKGPNTVGKDIGFITAMYPSDSNVVMVSPLGFLNEQRGDFSAASRLCREKYSDVARATNYDEGASIFVNQKFLNARTSIWTTTTCAPGKAWRIENAIGYRNCFTKDYENFSIFCIRRPD
ncbi:MAG: type II secretion system GspH family protein [Fusobacterium sp.]|nr:type II secretion system GspH family protein [Fusobacterium sp.]